MNLIDSPGHVDFACEAGFRVLLRYSASDSQTHSTEGEDYLVSLIDSPGHADFASRV